MLQISNNIYCDKLFKDINISNAVMASPYKNYPYLIIKNFVPKSFLKNTISHFKKESDFIKAKIKGQNDKGFIKAALKEDYRKTHIYNLDEKLEMNYRKKFLKYKGEMEKFFNIVLTNSSPIQALEYKKGFFYKKHADDSSEIIDKEGNIIDFVNITPHRKLTTVLFCSSWSKSEPDEFEFSGGELLFNYLYDEYGDNVKIRPEAGDMVIFPSNPYFSHEVLPVTDGYRLTLVQWHDALIL